jgi:hypothetical protein
MIVARFARPNKAPPDLKTPGNSGEGLALRAEQDDRRPFCQTDCDGGGAVPAFQLGPFMWGQRDDAR